MRKKPTIDANGKKEWWVNGKLHRTDGPAAERADGSKWWYVNGKLHRTDGPAVEWPNGIKYWYVNDKRHRVDGPAVEEIDGHREWYVDGQRHRTDGPAIKWPDGSKWWYVDGQRHRTDGPAVELPDGTRQWWIDGELHRTDGPAIEYADGSKEWWVDGIKLTREEFEKKTKTMKTKQEPTIDANETKSWYVDGKLHRLDGPAVIYADGTKEWHVDGQRHRTDGPATERADGSKWWYVNGKLHRTDGPAVEWPNGIKYWYVNGIELSREEFEKKTRSLEKKKQEKRQMATNSDNTIKNKLAMVGSIVKDDLKDAAWRSAAEKAQKLIVVPTTAFLTKGSKPSTAKAIGSMLETPRGTAVASLLVGSLPFALSSAANNPKIDRMCRELRILAAKYVTDELASMLDPMIEQFAALAASLPDP